MCLLNLLIPGAGYLAARDVRRGVFLFLLLNGVFFLGLAYDGYMYVPPFSRSNPAFNIVSLLIFIAEACHLGGTALLIVAEKIGGALGGILVRNPGGAYSDIGTLHFVVGGILNYFATVRLWDLLAGNVEEDHSEASEPEPSTQTDAEKENAK